MNRVRFAPSPTGYLHIGGMRTCLYNWLFARKTGASFILRIEDTDQSRSEPQYLDDIVKMLKWLGLHEDEGPFFQSQRINIYQEYASKLMEMGMAYEERAQGSPGCAMRFRLPREEVSFNDLVYGEIKIDNSLAEDFIIIKSDGMPAYNFACVVDDALMGITHVIRGEDHVSNTPRQIALYQALDFPLPQYVHVPMILGHDGKRLSKRHGATSVAAYKDEGYVPQGLLNYLALLGWSPGDDREVMDLDEMISSFSLERINKKSAVFDPEKLIWMNGQHIRKMPIDQLQDILNKVIDPSLTKVPGWKMLVELHQPRLRLLNDFPQQTLYYYQDKILYEAEAIKKHFSDEQVPGRLLKLAAVLEGLETYNGEHIERGIRDLARQLDIKVALLIHPARIALTGGSASPGIFDIMVLLGRARVCERLKRAADWCKENGGGHNQ